MTLSRVLRMPGFFMRLAIDSLGGKQTGKQGAHLYRGLSVRVSAYPA